MQSSTIFVEKEQLVASIDQGTSSSRVLVFNAAGEIVVQHQVEFPQYYPQAGSASFCSAILSYFIEISWHEHDPEEIYDSVKICLDEAVFKLRHLGIDPNLIRGIK